MVPVVVGALSSVSKKLTGHLEQLGIGGRTRTMHPSNRHISSEKCWESEVSGWDLTGYFFSQGKTLCVILHNNKNTTTVNNCSNKPPRMKEWFIRFHQSSITIRSQKYVIVATLYFCYEFLEMKCRPLRVIPAMSHPWKMCTVIRTSWHKPIKVTIVTKSKSGFSFPGKQTFWVSIACYNSVFSMF